MPAVFSTINDNCHLHYIIITLIFILHFNTHITLLNHQINWVLREQGQHHWVMH